MKRSISTRVCLLGATGLFATGCSTMRPEPTRSVRPALSTVATVDPTDVTLFVPGMH